MRRARDVRRDSIIAVPRFVAAEAWVRFPVSALFALRGSNFFAAQKILQSNKNFENKNDMIGVGFEPTPPKRPVPETGALDRSAIQPPKNFTRGHQTLQGEGAD